MIEVRLDRIFREIKELIPVSGTELLTPSIVHGVIPQSELGMRPQQAFRDGYSVAPAQPNDFVISLSSHAHGIEWCGLYGGISPDYTLLRPTIDVRYAGYLKYALKSQLMISQLGLFKTGIRMGLRLRWNKVRYCKVSLPSLEDAVALSRHLDRATTRIDALVAKKARFVELLLERRQALITHAVTKGLNTSVPMKNSGVEWLGDVPLHWEVVRGSEILVEFRSKNDPLVSENYLSLMANVGIIPYAEKGDVGNKRPEDLTKCKLVAPGDFVINSMNYQIGSYGVSRYAGICSPVYVVMRHRADVADPKFIDLILSSKSYQNYAQSYGTGILDHRRAIGWDEIKIIRVPLPPLDEQAAIANWAIKQRDRIDALIAKTERSIELLREHRTALITAAVTGKIDLRELA